jgi:DHA1 family inner membrane transport protein
MNQPRASLGLYALTLGAFAIGTTEFVPVGLLPEIARDLHVSISAAGFLVTGYALGVAIGAPLFTIALNRVNRKTVLILMLTFFIAGNGLAAVANDYGVLLLARIIAAFNHGTFFGIGAIVAGSLVPKERSASAIATMFLGLTVAMVMGVPFGAFVGQHLGWHAPFALIALIGVLALAGVWLLVPSIESKNPNLTAELRTLASGPVMLSLLTTLLGFGGVFVLFTYISPLLQEVTGFTPHAVAALLVLFGVGTLAGNLAAGRAGSSRSLELHVAVARTCDHRDVRYRLLWFCDRNAVAAARHSDGEQGTKSRVVGKYQRLQYRQCAGRRARRRGHRRRLSASVARTARSLRELRRRAGRHPRAQIASSGSGLSLMLSPSER